MSAAPESDLFWPDSCRLIPSRFPPVSLFEQVAAPSDLDIVFAIEALGNPRLRQQVGELSLVPPAERISGPGSSAIMAAFTHLNPEGSRFSDGSYGVYYAAESLETAVAEVSHHRARFLASTAEPPLELDLRCYRVTVRARLLDVRGQGGELHDAQSYQASQRFALEHRAAGALGIAYDSVRRPGGSCVALFTPRATQPPARQAEHVSLVWDGQRIAAWYLKSELHSL